MPYPVIPDIPAANINGTLASASYPAGATPLNATSGDVAAATAAATLAGAANKTTYITGFTISGAGATGASVVLVTITDGTWTLTYDLAVVAGAALQNAMVKDTFNPPLPASAPNTAIVVSCPTLGTGNLHNCANAYGYRV